MTEDEIAPPRAVVGIGASAGGLAALTSFFSAVNDDTDLAFVVVTHQPADSNSYLRELLEVEIGIPVVDVDEEQPLRGGVVYVQVGAHEVSLRGHKIGRADGEGAKLALVDRFFRTLADTAGRRAVCIVLSGGGTDGTVGAAEVKAKGGFVMAQAPEDAVQPGMPSSVIEAGIVDCHAPASELPQLLHEYVTGPFFGEPDQPREGIGEQKLFSEIFDHVVEQTGTDFGEYKPTTIRRRVERRMNVLGLPELEDYVKLLADDPSEVEKLFHELLIGVTSFFRDPETWAALKEKALVELVEGKSDLDPLRAWVPACSTGEEAYSLAILLTEVAHELGRRLDIQVFATDVDDVAIETARRGVYPEGIVVDVGEERLGKYFVNENSHYRVCGAIRERVVFAPQDLLVDPPFTEVDVLSCRNFFIYLEEEPRRRLVPLFHYALSEGGILFMGPSESLDDAAGELFDPVDKKARIFCRRDGSRGSDLVQFATAASRMRRGRRRKEQRRADNRSSNRLSEAERVLLGEVAPPSILCESDGTVIHIHGRTGKYLEPSPGPQGAVNILDMAREGLSFELSGLLRAAKAKRPEEVQRRTVPVKFNGDWIFVDLRARCLDHPRTAAGRITVSLIESPIGGDGDPGAEVDASRISELEERVKEISGKRQDAIEDLQVANEELRSINEELQSTNEELQSSNEELKTSKEEVQSLNEELRAVNAELQQKVDLLSRANDDMTNLLNGTDIATFFLDNELKIKRYTDRVKTLVNLIPSDVGRSIGDLAMKIDTERLTGAASEVLETLRFRQIELESSDGNWYLARILPYRTGKNVIDGLVITFTEITELKQFRQAHEQIVRNIERSPVAVAIQDEDLIYRSIVGRPFGHRADELMGERDEETLESEIAEGVVAIKEASLTDFANSQGWVRHPDGAMTLVDVAPELTEDGDMKGLVTVSVTVSEGPWNSMQGAGDHNDDDDE